MKNEKKEKLFIKRLAWITLFTHAIPAMVGLVTVVWYFILNKNYTPQLLKQYAQTLGPFFGGHDTDSFGNVIIFALTLAFLLGKQWAVKILPTFCFLNIFMVWIHNPARASYALLINSVIWLLWAATGFPHEKKGRSFNK